jgi:putative transposase
MSKPIALEYGCYYHIYNRGVNRENIFFETRNYAHFLKLHARYVEPVAETFAYCLLKNHFHVLVRIKRPNEQSVPVSRESLAPNRPLRPLDPSQALGNCFDAYAKAINRAYQRTGSLFQHPFGRVLVRTDVYFANLITYIHQNPQRHGLIEGFREWPYSSYDAVLSTRSTHIPRDDVLSHFGGQDDFRAKHIRLVTEAKVVSLVPDDPD